MKYPDDEDGDALRRVAERSDMSQPMIIDFFVNVPDEPSGREVARMAAQRGYTSVVEFDQDGQQWTCYCSKRLVPTYDAIVASQQELDNLSAAFGGCSDGWGTLGN